MDPLSIGATIVTIIALVAKSATTLTEIRFQCAHAELKLELLAGQLQTVQAALRQVHALISGRLSLEDQHRQLVVELLDALHFSKLIVQHLDNHLSSLWTSKRTLKLESRIRLVIEDKAIEEYLKWLAQQVQALNLLLSAFNLLSPREQKKLLNKAENRSILEQAGDDASSLAPVDDSASMMLARRSSVMSTLSQVSKVFTFDDSLLRHKTYQNSFRSMLRRASTSPTPSQPTERSTTPSNMTALELQDLSERSARLDSMLKADAQKKRSEVKMLALGHSRSAVTKQLRTHFGSPFSHDEIQSIRGVMIEHVIRSLMNIVEDIETKGSGFATEQARCHVEVLREFSKSMSSDCEIGDDVSTAARSLWRHWLVQQNFRQSTPDYSTVYVLESTDRIVRQDYEPTKADIIRAPERLSNVRETKLAVGCTNTTLIEVPHGKLGRVIHQFDDVDATLMTLDLTTYDRYNEGVNVLRQGIRLFSAVCRSILSPHPIMLVFVNMSAFCESQHKSPFNIHFPEFASQGRNDTNAAANFLVRKCKRAVGIEQDMYWHFADDAGDVNINKFFEKKVAGLPGAAYMLRLMGLQPPPVVAGTQTEFRKRLLSSHSI